MAGQLHLAGSLDPLAADGKHPRYGSDSCTGEARSRAATYASTSTRLTSFGLSSASPTWRSDPDAGGYPYDRFAAFDRGLEGGCRT